MVRYQPPSSRTQKTSQNSSTVSKSSKNVNEVKPVDASTGPSSKQTLSSASKTPETDQIRINPAKQPIRSPKPNETNKTQEEASKKIEKPVKNDNKESKDGSSLAEKPKPIASGVHGGLLKINQNTLNEIIAQNERLSISERDGNEFEHDTPPNRRNMNASHSKRYQNHDGKDYEHIPNPNQAYKKLFDPNNPSKPILIPDNSVSKAQPYINESRYDSSPR